MNAITRNIKQRLSLREPLQESLGIVAELVEKLEFKKEVNLERELEKVKDLYPTCTDFEQDFVSLAFSIATGVGKTRLMGAIITYLHLKKGVKNFFILAPGTTIYEKLIEDFGNPSYHKYVFNGISEFVHNRPVIITGENYNQLGGLFSDSEMRINIFNIDKFNKDNTGTTKKGRKLAPRIKRLSEYLGQSYWDYLSNLDDLVILMDEAHRYRAEASKKAINELKPILGIELTATPFDEKGKVFKNIVYEYSLAKALADGKYVKNPAIATRKNFEKGSLTPREIDIIKLEDAISVHQDTRNELEIYARNNEVKLVKPFVLVVCKDIAHATEIFELINSTDFYNGQYIDKVLQIDSSTKKEEDIERQFVSLESPDNEIEIVIHVNMLKEGWDVTNLYTIVPLRAANAKVLIEQTIGRGLRLPYGGKRTGDEKVDKLTVIAHDNFNAVIKEAKDPNSILNKMSFVEIDEEDLSNKTEVITSQPKSTQELEEEEKEIEKIQDEEEKQKAQNVLDAKKAIIDVIPEISKLSGVNKIDDLQNEGIKKEVISKIEKKLNEGQTNLFAPQILEEAREIYDSVISNYKENIIEIPRMDLVQGEAIAIFKDFDLNTSEFNYQALEQEIIRVGLIDDRHETIGARSSGSYGNPIKILIAELINYPEIDYDDNADLLYKLATQAYDAIEKNLDDTSKIREVIFQFKKVIADKIYQQMKSNFELKVSGYIEPKVFPFVKIEPWNFSKLLEGGTKDYQEIIKRSEVPKMVFTGFQKACHLEYKFDSTPEQDLAYVLEHDDIVLKWMRPAPRQFRIYWNNNASLYEPDFIVETTTAIHMIEVKSSDKLQDLDVLAKKAAAMKYCEYATKDAQKHGKKSWSYHLFSHDAINRTNSLDYLLKTQEN